MSPATRKRSFLTSCVAFCLAACLFSVARAGPTVDPGWDLFDTRDGTSFMGVPFTGVDLGTFDFGGAIGVHTTGDADTIVQRLATASAPSSTIPVEMVALQLMSTVPVDFGLGVGFYFITLQSARGGPATTGSLTIDFGPEPPALTDPHGTFSSFFDVFFDVRLGSLTGPIALAGNLPLTSAGTIWGHQSSDPDVVEIPGVNTLLNGSTRAADFFPLTLLTEQEDGVAVHVVGPARAVPEPGTLLLVVGFLGWLGLARRRAMQ